MKLTMLALMSAFTLVSLSGCAGAAEPDEAGFLEAMDAEGYSLELMDTDVMLDAGHKICDDARDAGETVTEHASAVADFIQDDDARHWHMATAAAAVVYLCPDLE